MRARSSALALAAGARRVGGLRGARTARGASPARRARRAARRPRHRGPRSLGRASRSSRRRACSACRRRAPSFDELVHEVERLRPRQGACAACSSASGPRASGSRARRRSGAMLAALGARAARLVPRRRPVERDARTSRRAAASASGSRPPASVDAVGLAAQTVYFHKLLAEELGLDVDFLQVGKYKGAEEPFTRDGPSPEARASLAVDARPTCARRGSTASGTARPAVADGHARGRTVRARGARRSSGSSTTSGYFDEAREALEKDAGAVRAEVRLGAGATVGRRRRSVRRAPRDRRRVARDGAGRARPRRRRHLDGGRRRPPLRRRRHRRAPPRRGRSARLEQRRRREGGRPAHRLARRERARERSPLARADAHPRRRSRSS